MLIRVEIINIVEQLLYWLVEMRNRNKTFLWKPLPQNHFQIKFYHPKGRNQIVWAQPLELGVVIKKDQ
jgi:hypothetical protein